MWAPHGRSPWTSTGIGCCVNMCDDPGCDTLGHVCLSLCPPRSVGEQSEHPRNATSAASEHPQVPGAGDFRDFVLEMQQTIADLRTQVRGRHCLSTASCTSVDLSSVTRRCGPTHCP